MADDLHNSDPTLPCLVCGNQLASVFQSPDINQPLNATAFQTQGHYGSTLFDPMDSTQLQINVCDLCLLERRDRVHHIDRDGTIRPWAATEAVKDLTARAEKAESALRQALGRVDSGEYWRAREIIKAALEDTEDETHGR